MNLSALKDLLRRATKGPWETAVWTRIAEYSVMERPADGPFSDVTKPGYDFVAVYEYHPPKSEQAKIDAELICALRNNADALVARVELYESTLRTIAGFLDDDDGRCHYVCDAPGLARAALAKGGDDGHAG